MLLDLYLWFILTIPLVPLLDLFWILPGPFSTGPYLYEWGVFTLGEPMGSLDLGLKARNWGAHLGVSRVKVYFSKRGFF